MICRLLLFKNCNRNCELCCNKQFDLESLPICKSYTPYSEVILTGGEPLINPSKVHEAITKVRKTYGGKIYLYTAKTDNIKELSKIADRIDGLTVTLHEESDIENFERFARSYKKKRSFKLCVFEDVPFRNPPLGWNMKLIKWLEDCPLPPNEVFMRYE